MQEMLFEKAINWNDYPTFFKRGIYIQRKKITSKLTKGEIDSLPPLHNARKNPEMEITRTIIDQIKLPPLTSIANTIDVIFKGAEPILKE